MPGAVTALIGPSGCGKSTFLRILNRMHEMITGAQRWPARCCSTTWTSTAPAQRPTDVRRRIGMVFQKPNPFPAMSIYDNVASGLKLAGIKVASKDALVEASLRRAGLWNEVSSRLQAPGGGLSGGQQQRLCIARALAGHPRCAADGRAVLGARPDLDQADRGDDRRAPENQVTIVIVTHNMQQARGSRSKCAFFLAAENTPGHIVEAGPTEQMFELARRPADRRLRQRPVRLSLPAAGSPAGHRRARGTGALRPGGPRFGMQAQPAVPGGVRVMTKINRDRRRRQLRR